MTFVHDWVVRYASAFALHVIASSIVLAIAIAASYLPRLSARTRFAILAAGVAKFLLPASLFAPFITRAAAIAVMPAAMSQALPIHVPTPVTIHVTPFDWIAAIAGVIALLVLLALIISSFRATTAALTSSQPASAREVSALNAARKRTGVRHAVDIIRSQIAEAPAVLRVLRPLIVLPADGADTLDDDELESLLCHECAHVARHDNLLALVEGLVRAVFWFNPLLWLAHRRLAEEREKACDEIVAEDARRAETYAQALVKICEAILARPAAGVSCMASAHLKQRMEHIMRYQQTSARAFWHLAITGVTIVFLFATVAATAAISRGTSEPAAPYKTALKVGKIGEDLYSVRVLVYEKNVNNAAWSSRPLQVKAGEAFNVRGSASVGDNPEVGFHAEGRVDASGQVSAHVEITNGTEVVQSVTVAATPKSEDRYTGTPISMNLKDADIRDVLKTFAQLTGLEIIPGDGVEGKVTVNMQNVPWDKALDMILSEHGYTWQVDGDTMKVTKR